MATKTEEQQQQQRQQVRQKQLPDPLSAAYVGQLFALYRDDDHSVLARAVVKTIINRGAVLLIKPLPLAGSPVCKKRRMIRLRRNEKSAGYAVQKNVNGVWHFRLPLEKRHRDTWLACEEV